jgi:hypothetical protein
MKGEFFSPFFVTFSSKTSFVQLERSKKMFNLKKLNYEKIGITHHMCLNGR